MCLYINHELTNERLKDAVDKWRVYKHLSYSVKYNRLIPTYFFTYSIALSPTGFYCSDRPQKELTAYEQSQFKVSKGIHVYYNSDGLSSYKILFLPCWGYKEDLIAFGSHEAVFMKVQFIKEEVLDGLKDYLFPEHIPFIMQQLFPEK